MPGLPPTVYTHSHSPSSVFEHSKTPSSAITATLPAASLLQHLRDTALNALACRDERHCNLLK